VVCEAFARAHELKLGDLIGATVNGRHRSLRVVGIALSPEFIYQLDPSSLFPDYQRFGILWLGHQALANAFDMNGAFNDLLVRLAPKARPAEVMTRLDRLFSPYGGLGAYGREEQLSNRYLMEEMRQLKQMATIYPLVFLAVAAFLLQIAMDRLFAAEREEIGILKAFGYDHATITGHYLKLVAMIVGAGLVLGLPTGFWLGRSLSRVYLAYYHFPFLLFTFDPKLVLFAVGGSLLIAISGAGGALVRVFRLAPAVAMRPAPPPVYRQRRICPRLWNRFSQPTRMILRHLGRYPGKALFSVLGIAAACAVLLVGSVFKDAVDYLVKVHFGLAQQDDLTVNFTEPTSYCASLALRRRPSWPCGGGPAGLAGTAGKTDSSVAGRSGGGPGKHG